MQELKRKMQRRLGSLVITIGPEGIELRGYRKRANYRRKLVTWDQIASLSDADKPVLVHEEQSIGQIELQQLGADAAAERVLCSAEIWNSGKPSPRSCRLCKCGPCKFGVERKPVIEKKPFALEDAQ